MNQAADELAEAFRAWDKYPTDNGYVRMLNALTRYDAARAVPVWEDRAAIDRAAASLRARVRSGVTIPADDRDIYEGMARAALRAALGGDHA